MFIDISYSPEGGPSKTIGRIHGFNSEAEARRWLNSMTPYAAEEFEKLSGHSCPKCFSRNTSMSWMREAVDDTDVGVYCWECEYESVTVLAAIAERLRSRIEAFASAKYPGNYRMEATNGDA